MNAYQSYELVESQIHQLADNNQARIALSWVENLRYGDTSLREAALELQDDAEALHYSKELELALWNYWEDTRLRVETARAKNRAKAKADAHKAAHLSLGAALMAAGLR